MTWKTLCTYEETGFLVDGHEDNEYMHNSEKGISDLILIQGFATSDCTGETFTGP